MSNIRSKGTKIEKLMAEALDESGIKYVSHPKMFGNPDFLVSGKIAVFCDGDFWHGYKMETNPRLKITDNKHFWHEKISRNKRRDNQVNRTLKKQGFIVIRFWEHDIKKNVRICRKRVERSVLNRTEECW